MSKKLVVIALLVAFSAGCITEQTQVWNVGVDVSTISNDEPPYQLSGTVGLSGKSGAVSVRGVQVVFKTQDGRTLNRTRIGVLSNPENLRENFTARLSERPHYVLLKYNSISQPDNADGGAVGLQWDGTQYISYAEYDASIDAIDE